MTTEANAAAGPALGTAPGATPGMVPGTTYRPGRPLWAGLLLTGLYFIAIPWALRTVAGYIAPYVSDSMATATVAAYVLVPLGVILSVLGAYVAVRGHFILAHMGKGWPGGRTLFLVDTNTYRFVRHPVYWGYTLFWIGRALAAASWSLMAASGVMALVFIAVAAAEEADLARRFGQDYTAYRRSVGWLIPDFKTLLDDMRDIPNVALFMISVSRAIGEALWRVRAVGMENIPRKGPVVFASNHMTNADPYVIGLFGTRMIHYVTADEVFRHPFGRWFFGAQGAIRKKKWTRNVSVLREMKDIVSKGGAVGIFPQGQYNWDGGKNVVGDEVYRVLHFLDAPVVPSTFVGAHEAWPAWSFWPAMGDWEVRFFEPVHPRDYPDIADFREALESKMFSTHGAPPVARRGLRSHKGITIVMWGCIRCGGVATLSETREGVVCSKCHSEFTIGADLKITDRTNGRAMTEWQYRSTLLKMLADGELEDSRDGVLCFRRRAKAFKIESTDLLTRVGEGELTVTNDQLTLDVGGGGDALEIPIADITFTFLNAAGHLVVSAGPHGVFQFALEGDSNLRLEDYLMYARGNVIRTWPTPEEIRARARERHRQVQQQ